MRWYYCWMLADAGLSCMVYYTITLVEAVIYVFLRERVEFRSFFALITKYDINESSGLSTFLALQNEFHGGKMEKALTLTSSQCLHCYRSVTFPSKTTAFLLSIYLFTPLCDQIVLLLLY